MIDGRKSLLILVLLLLTPFSYSLVGVYGEDTNESSVNETYGWINGTVTSKSTDQPIENCQIEIINTSINNLTNDEGSFSMKVDPNNNYTIRFSKKGCITVTKYSGYVDPNKTVWINLSLKKEEQINQGKGTIKIYKHDDPGAGIYEKIIIANHSDHEIFYEKAILVDFHVTNIPYCYLDVLPGKYDVIISYEGRTIKKVVNVTSGQTEIIHFSTDEFPSNYGTIEGVVTHNDMPVKGAQVELIVPKKSIIRNTDGKGEYQIEVVNGSYNISAKMEGYANVKKKVNVTPMETLYVNFTLSEKEDTGEQEWTYGYQLAIIIVSVLILIFIISLIVFLLVWKKKKASNKDETDEYICPECDNVVDEKAVRCPQCKYEFPWKKFRCPECGTLLDYNTKKCTECGNSSFELT